MTKSARNRKSTKAAPQKVEHLTPSTTEPNPAPPLTTNPAPEPNPEPNPEVSPVPEEPTFTRRIEVRLALPQPQVRYEGGKPVRDPAPDPDRIIAAIQPDLQRSVQAHYGPETEVVIVPTSAAGIRTTGFFGEKAKETQARVKGRLDLAFENLDLSE